MSKKKYDIKNIKWEEVKIMCMGKEITGIKSITVKEKGLSVDQNGLKRDFDFIDDSTGKKF